MSEVALEIPASVDRVWAVLADGWTYAAWVVGASHIRDVDATWPAPDSKLHHSVGPWPLVVKDYTEVVECRASTHLKLRARTWPIGEAVVVLDLEPSSADRCRVTMGETPTRGPAAWTHNPVAEALLQARNKETLERLGALASRGAKPE
ncbi:MAG: polyketide cyclase [Pseudonocardiales bacterium]|nr:MAG: polyketide cyclase [Pseudonocardiales bacterium]